MSQLKLFEWEPSKPIRAIDDRTCYDIPGSLEKLAARIREGKQYPASTDFVGALRYRDTKGKICVRGFFYGASSEDTAIAMFERVKLRLIGADI